MASRSNCARATEVRSRQVRSNTEGLIFARMGLFGNVMGKRVKRMRWLRSNDYDPRAHKEDRSVMPCLAKTVLQRAMAFSYDVNQPKSRSSLVGELPL